MVFCRNFAFVRVDSHHHVFEFGEVVRADNPEHPGQNRRPVHVILIRPPFPVPKLRDSLRLHQPGFTHPERGLDTLSVLHLGLEVVCPMADLTLHECRSPRCH